MGKDKRTHKQRMENPAYAAHQKIKNKTRSEKRKIWKETATPEEVSEFVSMNNKRRREWAQTQSGREKIHAMKRRAYERHITFINSHKKSCILCGEDTFCCLHFHHKDPSQKTGNVYSLSTRSKVHILAEIEKCVVLCANCHCKVHAGLINL